MYVHTYFTSAVETRSHEMTMMAYTLCTYIHTNTRTKHTRRRFFKLVLGPTVLPTILFSSFHFPSDVYLHFSAPLLWISFLFSVSNSLLTNRPFLYLLLPSVSIYFCWLGGGGGSHVRLFSCFPNNNSSISIAVEYKSMGILYTVHMQMVVWFLLFWWLCWGWGFPGLQLCDILRFACMHGIYP